MKILFSLAIVLIFFGCNTNSNTVYSEGSRVGVITKLSYKGAKYKTWEGELQMGGVRNSKDNNSRPITVANIWAFSIDGYAANRDSIANVLQELMDCGCRARIYYRQITGFHYKRGDTEYFVYKAVNLEK